MIALVLAANLMTNAACAGVPENHAQTIELLSLTEAGAARQQAENALSAAPDCAETRLAFALSLNALLRDASGFEALSLSSDYLAALDAVLAVDAENLRARMERIEFLIHAPAIAGGSLSEARVAIEALSPAYPLEAAELRLLAAREDGSDFAILAALEALADLDPGRPDAVPDLAQRLVRMGRYSDADARLADFENLIAPDDVRSRLATMWIRGRLRVLGKFEAGQAVSYLQAYLDGGGPAGFDGLPERKWALFRLGEALELSGDCPGAARYYADAATLDPGIDGLSEALERVQGCGG